MNARDEFEQTDAPANEGGGTDSSDDGQPPEGEIPFGPKRRKVDTASLLMFGLLAAVAGATYLMILRAGFHGQSPSATAAAADSTISTFLTGGVQDFRQRVSMLHNTESVVSQFNSYPTSHQVPVNELRTDPFTSPQFRNIADTPASDANDEQEQHLAATDVVHGLKLQSIVYGSRSVCMINGRPFTAGQGTGMFTVVKILPQSVVVRVGGEKFEIDINPAPQE